MDASTPPLVPSSSNQIVPDQTAQILNTILQIDQIKNQNSVNTNAQSAAAAIASPKNSITPIVLGAAIIFGIIYFMKGHK